MFDFIKNYIKKFIVGPEEKKEIPAHLDTHPYSGDPEDGEPILSAVFTLTDKGVMLIDFENSARTFEPIELASFISYIGSFRGQMDALDIIKEGMISNGQEEEHNEFLGHYISLKTQEASALEDMDKDDNTPCINPSEMMP